MVHYNFSQTLNFTMLPLCLMLFMTHYVGIIGRSQANNRHYKGNSNFIFLFGGLVILYFLMFWLLFCFQFQYSFFTYSITLIVDQEDGLYYVNTSNYSLYTFLLQEIFQHPGFHAGMDVWCYLSMSYWTTIVMNLICAGSL